MCVVYRARLYHHWEQVKLREYDVRWEQGNLINIVVQIPLSLVAKIIYLLADFLSCMA